MDIRLCLICQSTSKGHSHQWKNKNGVSTGEYFLIKNIALEWNNIEQIFNETSLEIKEKNLPFTTLDDCATSDHDLIYAELESISE